MSLPNANFSELELNLLARVANHDLSLPHVSLFVPLDPSPQPNLLLVPYRQAKENFERAYFTQLVALAGGRMKNLCKLADMERTYLYFKLRKLGVTFDAQKRTYR